MSATVKGFDLLVPTNMQTSDTTIENQKASLNVKVESDSVTPLKHVALSWFNKIGDVTIPAQSIQATLSKTGFLTSFADNLGLYKVATTDIAISKEDAIDIGMRIINAYASEKGRKIAAIEANLSYVSDINATRGAIVF